MKLIKEIFIFCVFTAVIYGVFTFVTTGKQVFDASALLVSNVDQINSEITSDWVGLEGWNADVYNREMTMIAQSHNSGLINDDARKSLYDRVNRNAYSKIVDAMNRQFNRVACNESVLADNYDGLMVVASREPGVEKIPEVADVENIYSLYRRVKEFNNRKLSLSPVFNGLSGTWTPSFTNFASDIRTQRDRFLNNSDFKTRLSHISEMKKIYLTENRINDARTDYYNKLASQIEDYYRSKVASIDRGTPEFEASRREFNSVRSDIYKETDKLGDINYRLRTLYSMLYE